MFDRTFYKWFINRKFTKITQINCVITRMTHIFKKLLEKVCYNVTEHFLRIWLKMKVLTLSDVSFLCLVVLCVLDCLFFNAFLGSNEWFRFFALVIFILVYVDLKLNVLAEIRARIGDM